MQPTANPSRPSVRFTALVVPTSTRNMKIHAPGTVMSAITGALKNGTISSRAWTRVPGTASIAANAITTQNPCSASFCHSFKPG